MAIPLTAIADAFGTLQKQAVKFDQLDEQRRLLALELQRTAPHGYQVEAGPDGRPSLKYVGMSDPRIQTALQIAQAERQAQDAARLQLEARLNPILAERSAAAAQREAELQRETAVYMKGLETTSALVTALAQFDPRVVNQLPPEARQFEQGRIAALAAQANALAPERTKAVLDQIAPETRALLAPSLGAPAPAPAPAGGEAQPPAPQRPEDSPRALGLPAPGQGPRPAGPAPAPPAPAQAAPAPKPPAEQIVAQSIREKLGQGRPVEEVREEAIRTMMASQGVLAIAAERGNPAAAVNVLSLPQVMQLVDRMIEDVQEGPARLAEAAVQGRRAEFEAGQLPILEAQAIQERFQSALLSPEGPADRFAPYIEVPITEPTEAQKKAGQSSTLERNENAMVESTRGDAEPIRRLRQAVDAFNIKPDTAAPLIKPFVDRAASELRKLQPRRAGDVLILTPQKGSALVRGGENESFRLTEGKDVSAQLQEERRRAGRGSGAGVLELTKQLQEAEARRRGEPRQAPEGLTPGGIYELAWAAAYSEIGTEEGVDPKKRVIGDVPRFIWINAPIRSFAPEDQARIQQLNEQVFAEMGRRPKQGGGIWLSRSRDL